MNKLVMRLAVFACITMLAGGVLAKKPDSPGNGIKQNTYQKNFTNQKRFTKTIRENVGNSYFNDERRSMIREYFLQHRNPKNCPPGLAKKNNGCLPPGLAKKWNKGQPLPSGVEYYDLPQALLDRIGRTPEGQKLVRVGSDLLLIGTGTGMVLDAFEDLGNVL